MKKGEKVFIPFDGIQPAGTDDDGLLGGFLGQIGQDHKYFPISFKNWRKVADTFKDECWDKVIKVSL